jgi:hypothetical protein
VHTPAADNNLHFLSQSRHVAPAAAVSAAAAAVVVGVVAAVAAVACHSSTDWHGTSAAARSHMDVEVAHRQACDAESAVALLVARRIAVATERRVDSARNWAAHIDW